MTNFLDLRREVPPAVPAIEPVAGWPPYMTVNDFLAAHLWPASRATLFIALREGKFHSFLIVDGKTRAKSRIIDVRSALKYLHALSEAAKAPNTKATTIQKVEPQPAAHQVPTAKRATGAKK